MGDNQFLASKELVQKAYQLKKDKQYQQARAILEEGLEKNPDNRYLKTSLADVFIYLNQHQQASSLADEVLAYKPDDNRALTVKGTIAYKQKNYQQALDFFKQAYQIKEVQFVALRLVRTHKQLKQYQQALDICRKWLRKEESNPYFLKAKAEVLAKMGQPQKACSAYDQYLDLNPDDEFAYKEYIKLKVEDKSASKAAQELKQLLKVGNRDDNIHLISLLAKKLATAKEYSAAVKEYKRALKLKPGDKFILHQLGKLLIELGEKEQAIEHLKQAFRQDPSDYYLRSSLVYAIKEAEEYQAGIEYFKEIIQNNSGFNNLWGIVKKLAKQQDKKEQEQKEEESDGPTTD